MGPRTTLFHAGCSLYGFIHFLLLYGSVISHPMCTNFKAPFYNSQTLKLCREYKEFGCCTVEDDNRLYDRYLELGKMADESNVARCKPFIRTLLCQRCSPFSAHLYELETVGGRDLPGLCPGYCASIYSKCKDVIPLMATRPSVLNSLATSESFCATMKLADSGYCYPDLVTNPVLSHNISWAETTKTDCLCLEQFDSNLRNPIMLKSAGDNTQRLFIGEQIGLVHVYFNKTKLEEPFLDITDRVLRTESEGDERGFLGLAFHPHYRRNGLLYVYYSVRTSDQDKTRISEFKVRHDNANKVNTTSERILLEIMQPYWNHNGGEMLFGTKGYLYAFIGDGGSSGDPKNKAQNKNVLLGKVLRIDVDRVNSTHPYAIPPDNPFRNDVKARPEIFAYGIRNIWRCSIDRGNKKTGAGKGRIFCGDVGQSGYEEIDIIEKGGNYGWNSREGFECYTSKTCGKIGPEVLPIYAYGHDIGKSVIGGHVYRGCLNPNLEGQYIFGDFWTGRIFRLSETNKKWTKNDILMCNKELCPSPYVNNYTKNILSFGEDEAGELYMLSTDFASPVARRGKVYKFVDPKRRGNPNECGRHITLNDVKPTLTVTNGKKFKDKGWINSAHMSKSTVMKWCLIVVNVLLWSSR